MTDPTPILECKGLSISYSTRAGEIPAVKDFDLTVLQGEAVGIVGESGCGKSTVAFAIMRYLGANGAIVDGELRFRGRDMLSMTADDLRDIRGARIAMVYQEPASALNPSMRIAEQLMEVPIHRDGASRAEARALALDVLADVKLPDPDRIMDAYPHQISGGQQQRVLIAMALISKPDLLLLDEPTTALDVTIEAGIVQLVKELSARHGMAMIYISHNLGLILETCDRVAVMYSGEVVETGRVADVFEHMRHPYTQGLFASIPLPSSDRHARPLRPIPGQLPLPHRRPKGCNFAPRCSFAVAGRCDQDAVPMRQINGDGHEVRCVRWDEIDLQAANANEGISRVSPGPVVLEVDRMRKYYEIKDNSLAALIRGAAARHVRANEDISFTAREAETVAIVGESGCGKSTFAKVLMGLEQATAGEVRLHGKDISRLPIGRRSPEAVGILQMVFQNPFDTLNPSWAVGAQIARVVRKLGGETDAGRIRSRVLELLSLVKLPADIAHRRPRQLSGGEKQRIGIARAFAGNPALVVADEPVSALDVSVQAAVIGLLGEIQARERTTLLFISHDLSVVRYLSDRVVVMYLGHVVEQGSTDQVFRPPYHPYTEALLSAVPIADRSVSKRQIVLGGELPSALDPPAGCPFQTRCPRRIDGLCDRDMPPRRELGAGHQILCHLGDDVLMKMTHVFAGAAD